MAYSGCWINGECFLSVFSGNGLLYARNSLHLWELISSCLSVATNLGSSLLVFQLALLVVLVTVKTSSVR